MVLLGVADGTVLLSLTIGTAPLKKKVLRGRREESKVYIRQFRKVPWKHLKRKKRTTRDPLSF